MSDKGGKAEGYAKQTRLVHGDWKQAKADYSHALVPPISSSVTYSLDTSVFGGKRPMEFLMELEDLSQLPFYIYARFDDPTCSLLEHKIALAEGGETALTFGSGMAAITAALMTNVSAGDEVLYHEVIYGNTHSLMTRWLPRFGVETVSLDLNDGGSLADAINEKTRVIYFETPVNPLINLVDIAAVRTVVDDAEKRLGRRGRIQVIVDNTFPTPFCQRPIEHGVDMVVCSLTKAMGGFGADLGGAVIARKDTRAALVMYREETGAVLSPRAAWNILTFGLPTLALRMRTMQEGALEVARFLEDHSKIRTVNYPGLESHPQHKVAKKQMRDFKGNFAPGSMLYFELDTDDDRAIERFTGHAGDNSYCISLAVSLGHTSTLMENPYNMTHLLVSEEEKEAIGLKRSGIRLSVGLEDPSDIISDLRECLDKV
ncbi:MAG: aminotransferase class I/II-fold pyridoxal phosphate-dependent enzyme [Candidatus Hydrogenedentota bacterium]|nr:MAG: aminotransferase class I/II-fold pyridoxal phosphate-dependent enzyme [Candidatus Hydrogenedentota bacterium]